MLAPGLTVPPVNVGVRSTPNYARQLHPGRRPQPRWRPAGVRRPAGGAFHVDLGSIFDLGALRPFQAAHLIPSAAAIGVNGVQGINVHTIALQVPISDLTRGGHTPHNVLDPGSVIGVWATASRRRAKVFDATPAVRSVTARTSRCPGWATRCSTRSSCRWPRRTSGTADPHPDSRFAQYVTKPELAGLLPALYPGVFPKLAAYTKPRADLPRSCSPAFRRAWCPASRTTPARCRPTCCG